MKAYKLTEQNGQTRNSTQWGENISHTAVGSSENLCSDGYIHFYVDPLVAVLMNPVHANFDSPLLWECETSGEHLHEALKSGCKTLTTLRQIPLPEITQTQKIAFGILCAKGVWANESWNRWADKWLSGEDRTKGSAEAVRATAYAASYAAVNAAASYAVSRAAAANAVDAVDAAADYAAAYSVAYAAYYAADVTSKSIDYGKIVKEAMRY